MTPDPITQALVDRAREHGLDRIDTTWAFNREHGVTVVEWSVRREGLFGHGSSFADALRELPPQQTPAERAEQHIAHLEQQLAAAREDRARLG